MPDEPDEDPAASDGSDKVSDEGEKAESDEEHNGEEPEQEHDKRERDMLDDFAANEGDDGAAGGDPFAKLDGLDTVSDYDGSDDGVAGTHG